MSKTKTRLPDNRITADQLKQLSEPVKLPKDLETEISVLGSLMLAPDQIEVVATNIRSSDFFYRQNRLVYEAILRASEQSEYQAGAEIETVEFPYIVRRMLLEAGTLEAAGGEAYLAAIVDKVPTGVNLHFFAKKLREDSAVRQLMIAMQQGLHDCSNRHGELRAVFDSIEQRILTATDLSQHTGPAKAGEVLDDMWRLIKSTAQDWIPTPFLDLNKMIGGLKQRDLVVVGARTSVGKTALALQLAYHASIDEKVPVLLFTGEMGREIVLARIVSAISCVPLSSKLLSHDYENQTSPAEKTAVEQAVGLLKEAALFIEEGERSIFEIRATARRLIRQHKVGLVIVDYLQQMQGPGENRVQAVGAVSRGLKALAMEGRIPVLALCQLRRLEGRAEPTLTDLRESGDIEQDADIVMLLHRPDLTGRAEQVTVDMQNVAELDIAKHRNGPVGKVRLRFNGPTLSFQNLDLARL